MYLNRNFHSNPTLSHSRFRYFIVDIYTFFSKEVETPRWIRGYESGFLVRISGFQDFCPCSMPSESLSKDFSWSSWLVKDFVYFWSFAVYNSVTLCLSDRFLQQKFIWAFYYRVFQIVVKGDEGIGNFTVRFFYWVKGTWGGVISTNSNQN